jgi:Pregnancy-associated plasma protein-A/Secretion system C-terminal sorting domain
MRIIYTILLFTFFLPVALKGQRACVSADYTKQVLEQVPALRQVYHQIENFTRDYQRADARSVDTTIITIPVVIHLLYNKSSENISDEQIYAQLNILNDAFRKKNQDVTKTPPYFSGLVADCNIRFCLAKTTPNRKPTTGIVRKYTPISLWKNDDRVKYTAYGGDDAWDSKHYLNIWVCNLNRQLGYASFPGGPADRDGVVITYSTFGNFNTIAPYDMGKTAIHEVGHWLNLKHIWGDDYCGDDGVSDTPTQTGYTSGCPAGATSSCNNGSNGDMYMNYMDFTNDACMYMFTKGQRQRMRALFAPGGARYDITLSGACNEGPYIEDGPLPVTTGDIYLPRPVTIYPNPATNSLTIQIKPLENVVGQSFSILSSSGQQLIAGTIQQSKAVIDISKLLPGMYILRIGNGKGRVIEKFTKL